MQIVATNDFAAEVDRVFEMLTDRAFQSALCVATGALEYDVLVDAGLVRTRRVVPTPSALAKLAGPRLTVLEEVVWAQISTPGSHRGTNQITVEGLPAGLQGVLLLNAGGRGATLHYQGDLEVRIPILGPTLARQAEPVLREVLEIQQQVGERYLAGQA